MVEDTEFRARETSGIDDAGMDEPIQNHDVPSAGQGADGSQGGGVTGGKAQRGRGAFEGGERLLELVVGRQRTADQPRGARAGPVLLDGLAGRLFKGGLSGQAEIVVGRKVEQGPATNFDARGLRGIDAAQLPIQSPVAQLSQPAGQFLVKGARHIIIQRSL